MAWRERQGCPLYNALLQAQSALSHGVLSCSCPMRESCESAHAPRVPQRLVVCCTALQTFQSLASAFFLLGTIPEARGRSFTLVCMQMTGRLH